MELNKETLEIVHEALNERSKSLSDIIRTGLTASIRKAAKEDFDKTNKAWGEVERVLYKLNNS